VANKKFPFTITEFGLTATVNENVTTVASTWMGTRPIDYCAEQAKKLYALTMLMTGTGFDAFKELVDDDQHRVMNLMNDLASQVAVLSALEQESTFSSSVREIANG